MILGFIWDFDLGGVVLAAICSSGLFPVIVIHKAEQFIADSFSSKSLEPVTGSLVTL